MRAGLYARVSTDEQFEEGHSIDAQLRVERELCARKRWTIAVEYVDAGISGRTLNRPQFQALLRDAREGRIDVIIVHKLDRLSRSLFDTLAVLSELSNHGVSFCSATEDFDFTTPIGKVLLALLAAFAQYFVDNLRQETAKGKKERALKGLYNGSLPFGYQRVPREQGGVPVFHLTNIEGYRLAMRMGAEGHSLREIMQTLNAAGYRTSGNWGNRPFSVDTVLDILKSRFYLGEVSYKGEWRPGKHEAAIDRETWERCQAQIRRRLSRPERTKFTDRVYPLRKLLRCASCGRTLRGQNQHGGRQYHDPALDYGDKCPEPKYVWAEILEGQIGAFLSRVQLPGDWQERVLSRLEASDLAAEHEEQMRAQLQSQLERAKKLYLLGDLSEREYLAERTQVQSALAAIRPTQRPDLERAAELLENFGGLWHRANDQERLRLMHAIIETAYVKGGKIIALEPRPAMHTLLTVACQREGNDGKADIRLMPPGTTWQGIELNSEIGSYLCPHSKTKRKEGDHGIQFI